jgi:putative IMPACT (imprinted ancient) family translation regulator
MAETVISKKALAQVVVERFSDEVRRRQVLIHALDIRGKMLAVRRQLHAAYAELGENIYARMKDGDVEELSKEYDLGSLKLRIDSLLTEYDALKASLKVAVEPTPLDTGETPGEKEK